MGFSLSVVLTVVQSSWLFLLLLCNSRTADVWAGEVVAQWQQQQQLAAEQGNLNKVFVQYVLLLLW